jgi:hypothetical protein
MVVEVQDLNANKLFKMAKLNLKEVGLRNGSGSYSQHHLIGLNYER